MGISIICCYNNSNLYSSLLVNSLRRQENCEYELIGIDNSEGTYANCAAALNAGVKKSSFDRIICVHQDFEFKDNDCLKVINHYFDQAGDFDIFGPAGALYDPHSTFIKKIVCRNRKCVSSLGPYDNGISLKRFDKIEVETLDECCFCFKKALWNKHRFSEELCPYWDLYGVEMCLYTKSNLGGNIFIAYIKAIHHSGGNITNKFYKSLYKIMKYYKGTIYRVVTTCVSTKNSLAEFKFVWLCLINVFRRSKSI